MPHIPSLAAFLDPANGYALKQAEELLIAACRAGQHCDLGRRPNTPAPDRIIRADLLRLLIIGGTAGCGLHDSGVWLEGAWIEGTLDLRYASARGQTVLRYCTFVARPSLEQANLKVLSLDGSDLRQGLTALRITVAGGVFLPKVTAMGTIDVNGATVGGHLVCTGATFVGPMVDGKFDMALDAQFVKVTGSLSLSVVTATGTIAVNGAMVGGQLTCDGATLIGPMVNGKRGDALNALGVQVTADLFMRNVIAMGLVDVSAAAVGGQFACTGATLDGAGATALNAQSVQVTGNLILSKLTAKGTVALVGATIGGQMDCEGASFDCDGFVAFQAQRLRVTQSLFWRGLNSVKGRVDLTAAHVGDLVDDAASWPRDPDMLRLDGFTYDRIVGGPTDAAMRLNWLRTGSRFKGTFAPQP